MQAVGAAAGLDRYAFPRSRKATRREIKHDCCVFPMPVNNLASRKRDGTFPERKRFAYRYVRQSRVAFMFPLQRHDTLDSILFLSFYLFIYFCYHRVIVFLSLLLCNFFFRLLVPLNEIVEVQVDGSVIQTTSTVVLFTVLSLFSRFRLPRSNNVQPVKIRFSPDCSLRLHLSSYFRRSIFFAPLVGD